MPTTFNFSFFPFIILGIILLVVLIVFKIIKTKNTLENHLNETFGKIPENIYAESITLGAYHKYYSYNIPNDRRIDLTTWNDLNMDDVFMRINACACTVGEEYLYNLLHELNAHKEPLMQREKLIKWLTANPSKRIALQKIILSIGKMRNNSMGYYLFNANTKTLKLSWLYIFLAFFPILGLFLIPLYLLTGIIFTIAAIIINIVVYYITCMMIESELESLQHFSALFHGAKKLSGAFGKDLEGLGYGIYEFLKPFKGMGGLLSGKTQQGLAELEAFNIILKAIFLLDLLKYNYSTHKLNKYTKELNKVFTIVGEIDSAISIASFRQSLPHYSLPCFQESNTIAFCGMFHPLLAQGVVNSAQITKDSIITGSNASGKSTFIKAVAVNSILAQTINSCCASEYNISFSYVATSMALRDNILSGESYFITEIKSLKRIIEYCKSQQCIVLIDEILRGTNTPERIAASTAILRQLHKTNSLFVVASHDIELTTLLADDYDNYHFCEQFNNDIISFDYLIKNGPSSSTNAIKLLSYMGFEKSIVNEATSLLSKNPTS